MRAKKKKVVKKDRLKFELRMPQKFDKALHVSVLVLICFGTLMIVSTSVGSAPGPMAVAKIFAKQAAFCVASYILLTFFANNFKMRRAFKLSNLIGVFLILALLLTLLTQGTLGSRAWIRIPIPGFEITIQPSEFSKTFMIVMLAIYIEINKGEKGFWPIVKVPLIFFLIIVVIVLFQNDSGTAIVLTIIVATCSLLPTHRYLQAYQKLLKILIVVACIGTLFLISDAGLSVAEKLPGHFVGRIQNAIDPFTNPYSTGYQLINGLYGFARGGLTGVGLSESIQKYGYLTQSDNDFILSIIVEETGIFGLLLIVIGYALIIQRLFYYAFYSMSDGYRIILVGTALYIFVHFALNVGGVCGLIPLTGVPLLFISSGGSSLMSISIAIGISQNVISQIQAKGVENRKKKLAALQHKKEPQGDEAL